MVAAVAAAGNRKCERRMFSVEILGLLAFDVEEGSQRWRAARWLLCILKVREMKRKYISSDGCASPECTEVPQSHKRTETFHWRYSI